jgi:PKD repeat protein
MIQASFTVTPTSGDVLATNFTITNLTTADSTIQQYTWDLGYDGLVYNVKEPVFTYPYPGTYTITLTAIDKDGNTSSASQQVNTELVYRDYIAFTQIPEKYADPGMSTTVPFKIAVISANPNRPLVVDLFATNSKSTPYGSVPDKWNFLTPTWKFTDINSNIVTSLSVVPIPVYKNNKVVAVSGTAEFYYIDSMSVGYPVENCPVLITATLQTNNFTYPIESNIYPYSSYTNNESVKVGLIWQVNDLLPNLLKVTGNYVEDINPKQWKDIKTTTLVTCHSNRALRLPGAEDSTSEVIFSYPPTNEIGNKQPLKLSLTNLQPNEYTVDEEPLYFQATDSSGSRAGGYLFTTVTSQTAISSTSIVANITAYSDTTYKTNEFTYPQGFSPNSSLWVSNPEKNTLNKITVVPYANNCKTIEYYKNKNILIDGYIKEVQVPFLDSLNTFNYNMSGFSGIYSMAIDPRNYDLVACDAELDRLYRYSNTGELLKTFELTSIGDYDPQKKLYDYWTWQTAAPYASATMFSFYSPTIRSTVPANYLMILGGLIQPTNFISITNQNSFKINSTISGGTIEYPPEDVSLDVIQLFSPSLPEKYISSLTYWTLSSSTPETVFTLTGTPSLSSNSSYYIVSVNGILQRPDAYIIDDTTKTITFSNIIPATALVHILYIPEISPPATWSDTFSFSTTAFYLTGNVPNYQPDSKSCFIVNIGGILQAPINYKFDLNNQRLIFNSPLPVNTPIAVTQISVPETINNTAAYTPAYLSLDRDYNIWVTLFNSVSVLKFDKDFNLLFSVAPTDVHWLYRTGTVTPDGLDFQSAQFGTPGITIYPNTEPFDIYTDEFFLKPPIAETDKENNCWVTYSHSLCCLLVKYSQTGELLSKIELDKYSSPADLAIDANNNVWVSNSYNTLTSDGNIQQYDGRTSTLLYSITGIPRPGYIALSREGDIWFTHSVRGIGRFDIKNQNLFLWDTSVIGGEAHVELIRGPSLPIETHDLPVYNDTDYFNTPEVVDIYRTDEDFGGLAVDVYNRVWVIDSFNNNAWVMSPDGTGSLEPRIIKIRPDNTTGYFINLDTGHTYTEEGDFYFKSAQAAGDWTGNRWYQKYVTPQLLSAVPISGVSVPFTVSEFQNVNQIRRVNESFNNAEYLKSLALPENLNSNTTLFDKFFAASVGTGYLSANQDIGQTVYERIANFVGNHSDIDTCNISQLLSLAEQTSTPASDYSAVYPIDILNMLDIASVPRAKLWGMKDEIPLLPQSIGEKYDTFTATVTAGDKIILKNKFDSTLSLISVPLSGGIVPVYPLSSFEGYGFVQPVTTNYLFYKLDPVYSGKYIENLIDWNSQYTTQSPTASTLEEWYGENGAIESAFRYLLTKNLFLK